MKQFSDDYDYPLTAHPSAKPTIANNSRNQDVVRYLYYDLDRNHTTMSRHIFAQYPRETFAKLIDDTEYDINMRNHIIGFFNVPLKYQYLFGEAAYIQDMLFSATSVNPTSNGFISGNLDPQSNIYRLNELKGYYQGFLYNTATQTLHQAPYVRMTLNYYSNHDIVSIYPVGQYTGQNFLTSPELNDEDLREMGLLR